MYQIDPQIDLLIETLKKTKTDFILINPLDYNDLVKLEIVFDFKFGNKIIYDGEELNISKVYVARHFRTDCVINFPDQFNYTTLYRHKIDLFLQDLCAVLSDKIWFPGKTENLLRGEQKCYIYDKARISGLLTPNLTVNSFSKPNGYLYKKSLGFPFTISYDNESGDELAITLNNELSTSDEEEIDIPWQWQTYIKPKVQIRCVYVSGKIWSFGAEQEQFCGKSLREHQLEKDVVWENVRLPIQIKRSLRSLITGLDLEYACPEFLFSDDGKYYFIDLNSCGDWYGFGSQEENNAIAEVIVSKLCD